MSSLAFLQPLLLWLLLLVPVYLFLKWWEMRRQRQGMAKFSDIHLFKLLNPTLMVSGSYGFLRQALMVMAVLALVLAIARPGGNPEYEDQELSGKGVDIMLLVDLSSSMNATDLAPSRIQATKTALKQFISRLTSDRIGLVVFAGTVSLQAPLTQDYRTAAMMVDILSTNFMPEDGTAIGDALLYGLEKIGKTNQKTAVMVLLTDGENTKGKPPVDALAKVKEAGTKVFTIGVGTAQGAKIPVTDEKGVVSFKKYRGEEVVTKLDEELLKKISQETGGKYFSADTSLALMSAYAEIGRLTKMEHKEKKKKAVYQEYYHWPALLALLLVLGEMFFNRRSQWFPRREKAEA